MVDQFDGGSFIEQDTNNFVAPFEIEQLKFDKTSPASYSLYSQQELLNFVTQVGTTVFGTAFVCFSGYEYVDFAKSYSNQGIYHYGICDKLCTGYNSLLLSPEGVDWAKNFNKIVFLSPILEEGYICQLNKITNAQIYVPMDKTAKVAKYGQVNLSREHFARIYSIISGKQREKFANVFDLYDKIFAGRGYKFLDVFIAIKVFEELNLLQQQGEGMFNFVANREHKTELSNSKIYSKLMLLKKYF